MERDRIAVLADGHLRRDDEARLATLEERLAELATRCAAVYILGDLFEVWLGLRTAEPHVARLGLALARLREAGVRTVYVEGNRDFGIGRGATRGFFDRVASRELEEPFGDRLFHFSHGDLVNPEDRPYRVWRAFAKGLLAPAAIRLLPDGVARRMAELLEGALRPTNRRHKAQFPEARCVAFAAGRVARGADVVIVGHFHREVVRRVEAGGRAGTFVSLPFWHQEPRPLLFDRQGRIEGLSSP